MFYEVDIPAASTGGPSGPRCASGRAELGLDVNLQHREIFEQVHRV